MKKLLSGLLGIISCFILFSCEKETIFNVDKSALYFTNAGGSQTVTLTANKPWAAASDQTWCKITPSGGEAAASSKIIITCNENTTTGRSCTITFVSGEFYKIVAVKQYDR